MIIDNFWEIISQYNQTHSPRIETLADVTKVLMTMEAEGTQKEYPIAFQLLKDFESSMRSHIWTEWHAQEFYDDAEATYST